MKKKFSKILGVGLTLALLFSLLLTAAPVSAISVATVTIPDTDDEISFAGADYAIFFTVYEELGYTSATIFDKIVVTFPDDTVIAAPTATITASPGWIGGSWEPAVTATVTWVFDADDRTITAELGLGDEIGEGASVRIAVTVGITNPTTPDDYTLTVETVAEDTGVDTTIEAAVESEVYTINPPTIDVPAGVVKVFNPAGIEFQPQTGDGAINDAIGIAGDDWLIVAGAGTYTTAIGTTGAFDGLTIQGAEGADVIIAAITVDGINFTLDNVTIDGDITVAVDDFILENSVVDNGGTLLINTGATDAIVRDTIFNVEDDIGIAVDEDDLVVTGVTFNIEELGVGISALAGGIDTNVDDSTFSGSSGVGINVTNALSVLDVEGSTFDGLDTAVDIDAGTVGITGNTIQASAAIAIDIDGAADVVITGNTFTGNNDDVLIDVAANDDLVQMMFNDILDNAGDDDGLLINNAAAVVDLNCANNWWGDPDGPGADAFSDDVLSAPFLTASVGDTGVLDTNVLVNVMFDERTTAGVTIESTDVGTMEIVGAAQYATNPGAAIDGALVFWDICVIDTTVPADVTEVTIRLYLPGITADTEVWVWAAARGEWLQAVDGDGDPFTPNLFGGFVGITVTDTTVPTIEDLGELPFVLVEPPAAAGELATPGIISPEGGERDIPLKPTFSWTQIADADGYYFELADNANFVVPLLMKLDGDLGRLIVTAYAYGAELPYSKAYYWRVKAVSGTAEAGDLVESDWASAVFITMDEPEEPIPPIEIVEAPTLPDIIIEQPDITIESPDITVPLPDVAAPITPSWIYVIIGVGAVLVIALLVLIVRTRRVA